MIFFIYKLRFWQKFLYITYIGKTLKFRSLSNLLRDQRTFNLSSIINSCFVLFWRESLFHIKEEDRVQLLCAFTENHIKEQHDLNDSDFLNYLPFNVHFSLILFLCFLKQRLLLNLFEDIPHNRNMFFFISCFMVQRPLVLLQFVCRWPLLSCWFHTHVL